MLFWTIIFLLNIFFCGWFVGIFVRSFTTGNRADRAVSILVIIYEVAVAITIQSSFGVVNFS